MRSEARTSVASVSRVKRGRLAVHQVVSVRVVKWRTAGMRRLMAEPSLSKAARTSEWIM